MSEECFELCRRVHSPRQSVQSRVEDVSVEKHGWVGVVGTADDCAADIVGKDDVLHGRHEEGGKCDGRGVNEQLVLPWDTSY